MFSAIPDFNQSLEMFKTMWDQNNTANAGSPFMPGMSSGMSVSSARWPLRL